MIQRASRTSTREALSFQKITDKETAMTHLTGYVGTYASPGAAGTYRFQLDAESGRLSEPELIYPQTIK